MEISPIMMAYLLLYCFLLGMAVGVFYDLNRIIRFFLGVRYSRRDFERLYSLRLPLIKKPIRVKQRKRLGILCAAVVFIGDLLTLLLGTLGIIILNYSYNYGELRAFTVIGAIVGFAVYYNSLGRLVMLFSEPLSICIKYGFLSFFIIVG